MIPLPSLLQLKFLHPRYWLIWFGIGLMAIISCLPHRLQIGTGALLGRLAYRLAGSRRRIVEINLSLCFPELTESQRNELVRKTLRSVGISVVESARVWFRSSEALRRRVTVHGLEHLQQAQAEGRGVILVGLHMSTLDICGAVLGSYMDIDVMYRANENPLIETLMTRGRMQHFPRAIERSDTRGVLRSLKRGEIVWYGADQDYGRQYSVFAPFFGVPAATISATSRFARISGATVIFLRHYRRADDAHYDIHLSEPLLDFPTDDEVADAQRINGLIEEAILPYPEQYWWVHRRFKTRPEGEAPIY